MNTFPGKIDGHVIRWYTDKDNYGKNLNRMVSFLAIEKLEDSMEVNLLFIDEEYEIICILPCSNLKDAFDTVDVSYDAWHRTEDIENISKVNREYKVRRLLLWLKKKIKYVVRIVIFLVFLGLLVYGSIPAYGSHVLWFELVRICPCLLFLILLLLFCMKGFINNKGFSKMCWGIGCAVSVSLVIFLGKDLTDVCIDFQTEPKQIYMENTRYTRSSGMRGRRTYYYISGMVDGTLKKYEVTGCDFTLLEDINASHGTVCIMVYEHSDAVVSVELCFD